MSYSRSSLEKSSAGQRQRRSWHPEHRRADVVPVDRFAWERALRGSHGLRGQGLAIALMLATYASRNGSDIFPGEARLAHDVGISVRTARRHLTHLVDAGLLTRLSHGGGRPSRNRGRRHRYAEYRLTLPPRLVDNSTARTPQQPEQEQKAERSRPAAKRQPQPQIELADELQTALNTSLTSEQVERIRTAALELAVGAVRSPDAWVSAVVRRNPARWRPVPDVVEPDCADHPGRPTSRCPECKAAASRNRGSWRDGPIYASLKEHQARTTRGSG